MKKTLSLLLCTSMLLSCEKVIDLKYKENRSTIVIEGNITNETGPYFVKISRSIPLKTTGANPTVDNANVTVTDDLGNSEVLTPTGNGIYRTNTLVGTEGRTYTLTAEIENEKYTATSTMPQKVAFDSVKVEKLLFLGDTEYNIIPVYTDPIPRGNNYRFLLTLNGKLLNQHFVQTDEVKNGVVNTFSLELNDDDVEFKVGDAITVQMQCIDNDVTRYFTTLALVSDGGPGGGTTPGNPPTNISNGALGVFSAHTIETKSTVIL